MGHFNCFCPDVVFIFCLAGRFLDNRTFATCSDDTTVVLWDARNLKQRVRTLRGHSNWVKNIEYDARDSLLVTSGFDGAIYSWDINKYQENQAEFKKGEKQRIKVVVQCNLTRSYSLGVLQYSTPTV